MKRWNVMLLQSRVACLLLFLCLACAEKGVEPEFPSQRSITPLWDVTTFSAIGPIAVDDAAVYVLDTTRTLRSLSRMTGAPRWSKALPNTSHPWGIELGDSTVIVAAGRLIGMNTSDGSERWSFESPEGAGTLPFSANNALAFPTSYRGLGGAVAVDVRSGVERWRTNVLPTDSAAATADQVRVRSPVVSGASVAAAFAWWKGTAQPKGGIAVLEAQTGQRRWSKMLPVLNGMVSTFPSRAAIGSGAVAVTSQEGPLYVFDELTGGLRWTGAKVQLVGSDTLLPQNSDFRPVTIVGQSVVVGSARGYIAVHDISGGTRRSSTDTELGAIEEIHAVGQSRVITTHLTGGLTLIDLATGSIRWRLSPRSEAERVYAIRVAGDTVFSVSLAGGVKAFRLP